MASSQSRLLKIDLTGAVKVCGCCRDASRYEITISADDHRTLKEAAQAVLEIHDGLVVPTEIIWRLVAFYNQIGKHSLGCKAQKCRTHLGDCCALWQPRTPESSQ